MPLKISRAAGMFGEHVGMRTVANLGMRVLFVLGGANGAGAEGNYSIAAPSYIGGAVETLVVELAQRSVQRPPQPACVGFPGLDPVNREFVVSCIVTTSCWKLSIGSVERRLSFYGLSGTVSSACPAADLRPVREAVVAAFLSCASDTGRAAAADRLLNEPMDASDPAKAAELRRQQEADPAYSKRFSIDELCKRMIGHRYISGDGDVVRDELLLAYLKPEFAPP
jgi:hypothetical protein